MPYQLEGTKTLSGGVKRIIAEELDGAVAVAPKPALALPHTVAELLGNTCHTPALAAFVQPQHPHPVAHSRAA